MEQPTVATPAPPVGPPVRALEPIFVAVVTYAFVFAFAHALKYAIDKCMKSGSYLHTFCMEGVTALQMCTCVFENGVIIRNYGIPGFFVAVSMILTAAGFTNRGFFRNILSHLEQLAAGQLAVAEFGITAAGQFIGSALAMKAAFVIWDKTAKYSTSHALSSKGDLCGFSIQWDIVTVMVMEGGACFALRFLSGYGSKTTWRRRYVIPVLIAGHLSASLYYIGVAGLNPMTAYARLTMCQGFNDKHFYAIYWFAAAIGWVAGAHIQKEVDSWLTERSKANRAAREERQREAKKEKKKAERKKHQE